MKAPPLSPKARRAIRQFIAAHEMRKMAVEQLDEGRSRVGARLLAKARERHHEGLTLLAGVLRHVAA